MRVVGAIAVAAFAVLTLADECSADRAPVQATRDPSPVLGLFSVPAAACSLVAAAGFTVVQTPDLQAEAPADTSAWVPRARSYLDGARRHGLRALVGLPNNWLRQHRTAVVRDAVRALRAHPALLAWHENDLAHNGEMGALQFLDRIIQDEDPAHGLAIEEDLDDDALLSVGRARMLTYYPVTRDSRRSARLQTVSERFPVRDLRVPFWPLLQAFGVDHVRGPAKHELVMPTRAEMQAALASALVAGASGIFFSPYLHPTTFDDRPAGYKNAYGGYRPLPEMSPEAWQSVFDTAQLAKQLLRALAGADPSETLRIARAPRGVEVGRWDTTGGTLVIVSNLSQRSADIELACDDEPSSIEWITTPEHVLSRNGRRLELHLPPMCGLAFIARSPMP
jgi:hypothetical protein